MIRRPVARPPVNETRSTRGSSESGAPASGPGAEHEVADPGRQPGLVEQAHQVDGGVRRQLAGLEHERVAGREAGRDLPGDLEQRVVPRRDQAAHADRLVHDPADDVGVAGVDHPAGLLGGDAAVVAEDARPRRRCRTRSRPGACRCRGTPSGRGRRRPARAGRRRGAAGRPARGRTCVGQGPSWKASWAAAMAAPVSSASASSTSATRVPSAGQRISRRAPARAGTHCPPTKSSATGSPFTQPLSVAYAATRCSSSQPGLLK